MYNPLFELSGSRPDSVAAAEMFIRVPAEELAPGQWRLLVRFGCER